MRCGKGEFRAKKHLWAANNFLGSMHRAVCLLRALGGEVCSHLGPGRAAGRHCGGVWPRPWMLTGMAMLGLEAGPVAFSLVRQAEPCQPANGAHLSKAALPGGGGREPSASHTQFPLCHHHQAGSWEWLLSSDVTEHFLKPVFSAGIILPPALLSQHPGPQPFTCSDS